MEYKLVEQQRVAIRVKRQQESKKREKAPSTKKSEVESSITFRWTKN